MTDEQKEKAKEFKTQEELSAYINSLEFELSDEAAEAVAGGIQAGDVMRHIRDEFILPPKPRPTTTEHDERLKRVL